VTTGPSDLDPRWHDLRPTTGDRLSTERVRDWAGGPVLVAVGADGTRHLLVRVPDGTRTRLPRPGRGLRITTRRLRPGAGPEATWIDVSCTDPVDGRLFTGLCTDLVDELPNTGDPDTSALGAVLNRWRRFWSTDRDGLGQEEQLGLAGELWTLLEWLPTFGVAALNAWKGPGGGRHDFVGPTASVEVKTTGTTTGPVVHRISRLDQLDEPNDGALYLLSLRAGRDPSGTDSLDSLINRARAAAGNTGASCVGLLDDRLAAVGIPPGETGRYTDPFTITRQELYRVDRDFPRLTSGTFDDGLPSGVVDVTYSLDTAACGPWLITDRPRDPTATQVFTGLTSGPVDELP